MTDTELRRLAENATPGPWRFDGEVVASDRGIVARSPRIGEQCAPGGIDDPRFIAAASPDVVIGLLDRCERAEAEVRALEKERNAARSEAVDHATDADARQLVVTALLSECEVMRDRIKALEVELDEARDLMPWRSDVVAFHQLAERAPPCDAAEDLASWCMMILRAHAAKGGE